jgi:hypothetical protein
MAKRVYSILTLDKRPYFSKVSSLLNDLFETEDTHINLLTLRLQLLVGLQLPNSFDTVAGMTPCQFHLLTRLPFSVDKVSLLILERKAIKGLALWNFALLDWFVLCFFLLYKQFI